MHGQVIGHEKNSLPCLGRLTLDISCTSKRESDETSDESRQAARPHRHNASSVRPLTPQSNTANRSLEIVDSPSDAFAFLRVDDL